MRHIAKIALRQFSAVVALVMVQFGACAAVAAPEDSDPVGDFEKRAVMIPMRDGVRLYTEILTPRRPLGPLPMMFLRTPYGAANETDMQQGSTFKTSLRELVTDSYIFVFQDIRGRLQSEGRFVLGRPQRDSADKNSIDESTDAYDTINWLLENVAGHNGRVGMHGVSYSGWLAVMASIDPHPALKAISPQAPPGDIYIGDDHFHNGAFRLSYSFEYVALVERGKETTPFDFDSSPIAGAYKGDTYDWYLKMGPLANAERQYFPGPRTMWSDFIAHPNYDEYWRSHAVAQKLKPISVPTLNVAGWFDQEDGYGPFKIFETLQQHDDRNINHLTVGPWNHGGWRADGSRIGAIEFGSDTALHYRKNILVPWFAYYLKDRGDKPPKVQVFQTGANQWEQLDRWPRANTTIERLYLNAAGRLSFSPPTQNNARAVDRYRSDPNYPVPYRARPIEPTFTADASSDGWRNWLVEDQRSFQGRSDVLTWTSDVLTDDLVISGDIVANLFASTTGTDADWIVKIIDVYPESDFNKVLGGYQLMIAGDVLRGRFRDGFVTPKRVNARNIEHYSFSLRSKNHRFRRGHRIMVQVQSTWFPLIDRNPQRYVANIFLADASEFIVATHSIFRSSRYPSHIALPVVTK